MRKFLALCLISGCLMQCDSGLENPNYPVEPSIRFNKISFIETPHLLEPDILKLTISYRDGDSDLGLRYDGSDLEYPYHWGYYFLEDGTGDTTKFTTSIVYTNSGEGYTLLNSGSVVGKLVTDRTRLKVNYEHLPEYNPNSCMNYIVNPLLVPEFTVDDSYSITDTINNQNNDIFYVVEEEALLYQKNYYHTNIDVKFFVNEGGDFIEFDWFEEYCIDYNGRFPFLGKQRGTIEAGPFIIKAKSPWEGEITYNMTSTGFLHLFSTKEMKLRITIKDRALHTSNILETPAFTLDGIKED